MACVSPVAKRDDEVIFLMFLLRINVSSFYFSHGFDAIFLFVDLRTDWAQLDEISTLPKPLPSSRIMKNCIFHLF